MKKLLLNLLKILLCGFWLLMTVKVIYWSHHGVTLGENFKAGFLQFVAVLQLATLITFTLNAVSKKQNYKTYWYLALIILSLAYIAAYHNLSNVLDAKYIESKVNGDKVIAAIEKYKVDNGHYPPESKTHTGPDLKEAEIYRPTVFVYRHDVPADPFYYSAIDDKYHLGFTGNKSWPSTRCGKNNGQKEWSCDKE